jgi:hypothetical protein
MYTLDIHQDARTQFGYAALDGKLMILFMPRNGGDGKNRAPLREMVPVQFRKLERVEPTVAYRKAVAHVLQGLRTLQGLLSYGRILTMQAYAANFLAFIGEACADNFLTWDEMRRPSDAITNNAECKDAHAKMMMAIAKGEVMAQQIVKLAQEAHKKVREQKARAAIAAADAKRKSSAKVVEVTEEEAAQHDAEQAQAKSLEMKAKTATKTRKKTGKKRKKKVVKTIEHEQQGQNQSSSMAGWLIGGGLALLAVGAGLYYYSSSTNKAEAPKRR